MNEKERIQVQKERAMAGLDLRNELQSPHVDEEVFDTERLLKDLQDWSREADDDDGIEVVNDLEESSINIQHVSKEFQALIDEYRPSVQVALNEVADAAKFCMQIRVGLNCAAGIKHSIVQTMSAATSSASMIWQITKDSSSISPEP